MLTAIPAAKKMQHGLPPRFRQRLFHDGSALEDDAIWLCRWTWMLLQSLLTMPPKTSGRSSPALPCSDVWLRWGVGSRLRGSQLQNRLSPGHPRVEALQLRLELQSPDSATSLGQHDLRILERRHCECFGSWRPKLRRIYVTWAAPLAPCEPSMSRKSVCSCTPQG